MVHSDPSPLEYPIDSEIDGPESNVSSHFTSVRDIGISTHKNTRRYMEDAHCVIDGFGGEPSNGFFSVYDGHGGKAASSHVACQFHKLLIESMNEYGKDGFVPKKAEEMFDSLYATIDQQLETIPEMCGTCAVTILLTVVDGKRWIFCANVGDTRAILARGRVSYLLSHDHKPNDPLELERIQEAKGFVKNGRVNGVIAVSRALGDHYMKQWIISKPFFQAIELKDEDSFMIIACDGVWDVIESQEAIDLAHDQSSALHMSQTILNESMSRGSGDNISVIVVKL